MDCVPLRQFGTGWHCEPRARLLLLAVEASARSRAREPRDCLVEREVRLERRAAPAFRGRLDLDVRWGRGGTPTILPNSAVNYQAGTRALARAVARRWRSSAVATSRSRSVSLVQRFRSQVPSYLARAARGIDYKAGGA